MKQVFENAYDVVFMVDGSNISSKKTVSIKLDISKFVKKYVSAEYHMTPENQEQFNERAYLEILEECSKHINAKKPVDEERPQFTILFTLDGLALKNMDQLKKYLVGRKTQDI